MDIGAILNNNYVVIGGGVLVLAVAVFIFRSGPKPEGRPKTIKEVAKPKKEKPVVEAKKESSPRTSLTGNVVAAWKQKMNFLKSIRARQVKQPVEAPVEEVLIPDILLDDTLQDDALYVPEVVEPEQELEVLDLETEPEPETGIDMPDESLPEADEVVAAIDGEEPTGEEISEEIEPIVETPPVEELKEPDPERSPDDIFTMFNQDNLEESEVSKFAATLESVDIQDLLQEVNDIRKYMS